MFVLGVVLDPQELQDTLREPKRIGLGVLAQFTVMPALGFAAAYLLPVSDELALGFIIVGCAPGAMASNVIVYLAGGAVAYSVSLTTVATMLAPVLTPALVKLLGGVFFEIEFWPMLQTVVMTVVVPLLFGMGLRRLLGARTGAGGRGRRHCHHLQLCRGRQPVAYCRARATGAGRCDYGECPGLSCWVVAGAAIPF